MNDTKQNYIVISRSGYDTNYDFEEAVGNIVIILFKNAYSVFVKFDNDIDSAIIKYWEYTYAPVIENIKAVNAA